MIGKKINQLATELAPTTTDLTIIGDPVTGVSKKITLEQLGAIFGGAVSFYTNLASFPATGVIDIIYCAKDTQKLYLWSGSAYVEVFPSQALLDTYQLRSEKGVSNGYASLDVNGKVPIGQLPNSIMEYKGTWNAATNTPTLANGTGDTGDVYICNAAGTVNFGAGPITFAVGDYVVYSGTIWQRSSGAVGTVTSVAVSRSGDALAITGSPITTSGTINLGFAGNSTQYINGAGNLVTFPGIINEAQNLITEVYNKTGATLTKGTVVYINGGQGNLPTVTKALATGDATSAQTYGIVRNDITNNNNGYVVVAGRISDLDTQAYTEGTQLYLSPTTAGTYTSTKPYAPNHLVYVGIVVRAHPTQGVVEVKIQNGYEMDELHNVAAQSPDNNDILQYKTATSLWTKVAGTTTNIAEGTNLYYTDARSRAALSFTAGSGAYNSTTGVITIPTNTNQLTNGAAFITLASLSAGAGISYNNTTGVIASTITQYTDALARAAISLTTTGTSGAATYNNTTGVLNIPQYQTALTNPVTGTGTTNYLPKFTGTSTIGNSSISDNGTGRVSIGTTSFNDSFVISNSGAAGWEFSNSGSVITYNRSTSAYIPMTFEASNYILNRGNLGLGVTPSAGGLSGYVLFELANGGASIYSGPNQNLNGSNISWSGGTASYKISNFATLYNQQSGQHQWYTAPSGTAGNAISFTQAMTLNASGNLSVGNTNNTYKLDVSGSSMTRGTLVIDNNGLDSSPTEYIRFERNSQGSANYFNSIYSSTGSGSNFMQFRLSNTSGSQGTVMTLTGTGNVGIGTNNPVGQFQVKLSTNNNIGFFPKTVNSIAMSAIETVNDAVTANTPFAINASEMYLMTQNATRLTIASTGAATFSSSVTAANGYFTGNSEITGMLQINYSDISTGENKGLQLNNTGGGGKTYNLTAGQTGQNNADFVIRNSTNNVNNLILDGTSGAATFSSTIQTASPSSGSAHAWKLGSYAAGGTGTATGVIYIEVNGQIYSIPALLGTP